MDRSGPTNLKWSRGERVSWGGEAEVKSTGTVPLLRRRHKVNTSAQPSGLQGTHRTGEPTLSLSLSSGAALSSLGSAGNGCFTHKRRKERRHRVAPSQGSRKRARRSRTSSVFPESSRQNIRAGKTEESFYRRTSAERLSAPERQTNNGVTVCQAPICGAPKTSRRAVCPERRRGVPAVARG